MRSAESETPEALAALAADLRAGRPIAGATLLGRNRVRATARVGSLLIKAYSKPSSRPRREAAALARAAALGLPVPQVLGQGENWLATRWIESRPAAREDLGAILELTTRMHAAGLLHGDLHVGNLLVADGRVVLTDLQSARFLPWVPHWLRRRELGYLAFSLGEPLPEELAATRRWCAWRAQRHWRSRTRRCLIESSGFTSFATAGAASGFRRRESDPEALRAALDSLPHAERLKQRSGADLYRSGGWIIKHYRSARAARRAWINACGLEARGIHTGRAVAWAGRCLVMEDAGATLDVWVDAHFAAASEPERSELRDALAELLAALHRRGIYHADLKANNVVWSPGATPRLLDYGRVHFGWRVRAGRRIRNLAQLNAALPDAIPGTARAQAFARYVEASGFRGDAAALRRRVVRESLSRKHRWSGC